jgi:branched-subunit amino acid aminotransferase/4-amino-4-deoxychorismate lyase
MGDFSLVLHNGTPLESPHISILDPIVIRGDGCFEAVRSYGGAVFGLAEHLARLGRSAERLQIVLPPLADIDGWVNRIASEYGDSIVRVFASAGAEGSNVYVFAMPVPEFPDAISMLPVPAPWHPAGADWVLAGVKTLSYAPNVAATRTAVDEGFDEALLVSRDGLVLEGPTSSVFWIIDGVLETPSMDLGILASITRSFTLAAAEANGIQVREGRFKIDRIREAKEVGILSTAKEVRPVSAVGDLGFSPGEVTLSLAAEYARAVERLRQEHEGTQRD